MNKQYSIIKMAFVLIGGLMLMGYNTGSPGSKTNAPDEGSCGELGCHGTGPSDQVMIFTDIPGTGYVAGNTYTITVSASYDTIDKYGFELACYTADTTLLGGLVGNDSVTAFSNSRRVTHKLGQTFGDDGKSWSFEWVAPSAGTGTVTFYTSVIAANGNNQPTFDDLFIDQLSVIENGTASISDIQKRELQIYPNPAQNFIRIDGLNYGAPIAIFDMKGNEVMNGIYQNQIDVNDLVHGQYIVKIDFGGKVYSKTLMKQ
ncbi:T9SS type A sorting domain-containing protein [bacterium]|nr:T9SS type A sorting domain-containing protein [bacterium]